jgi:hypothetical protein
MPVGMRSLTLGAIPMNQSSRNLSQAAAVVRRTDTAALAIVQRALRSDLTRRYETRRLELCPPAHAARVFTDQLGMPMFSNETGRAALAIYLPNDLEPHVAELASAVPQALLHPDIGLRTRGAYLSWTTKALPGQLPLSTWVELEDLVDAIDLNLGLGPQDDVPVLFIAGDTVAVAHFAPDDAQLDRYRRCITEAATAPTGYSGEELRKAGSKAQQYSERPWRFMRYELRAGYTRVAVNWAPVGCKNERQPMTVKLAA